MDELEKYIKKNKESFDVPFANKETMWNKLEQSIQPKETKVIPMWRRTSFQFAAAACLAGIIALTVFMLRPKPQENTICSIKGVSPEFCMQVSSYESNIQQKLTDLNNTKLEIPKEISEEVNIENNPMKSVLLNELKKNPNNPAIRDAILKYYKAKLDLIQRIEEVLRKQDKKIKNESNNDIVS